MANNEALTRETADVTRRLQEWRRSHGAPSPIPSEIWKDAVELASRHGICPTARAVGLDYGGLKKRVVAATSRTPRHSRATFVELLPAAAPHVVAACTIEVESHRGDKLRVQMTNSPPSGLSSLIREFVG
jgi:hypothetical protein